MAVATVTDDEWTAEGWTVGQRMALDPGAHGGLAGRLVDAWLAERLIGEPVWGTVPAERLEPHVSRLWWQSARREHELSVNVLVSSDLASKLRDIPSTCGASETLEGIGDLAVIRQSLNSVAMIACERNWLVALKLTRSSLWPGDVGTLSVLMDHALGRLTATAAGTRRHD